MRDEFDAKIIEDLKVLGYEKPKKIKNNFRVVTNSSTKKDGFLDKNNKEASDFIYNSPTDIDNNGYASANEGDLKGHLIVTGNNLEKAYDFRKYLSISPPDKNGYAIVTKKIRNNGFATYIDVKNNGKEMAVFSFKTTRVRPGQICLSRGQDCYAINKKGELEKIN